ncbi:MAG: serine/threonine-protein kinase [Planctomycetota bacterium]
MSQGQGSTQVLERVEACLDLLERGDAEPVRRYLADTADADAVWQRLRALAAAGLLDHVASAVLEELFEGVSQGSADTAFPEQLGEFRLLEQIGRGGMGVVYLAEQVTLQRRVAVKLVRPDHLHFGSARERFRREVQAVARLEHPGIVPVYAVGEERGIPYFAMEYIEGESLEAVLARVRGRRIAELSAADVLSGEPSGDSWPGEMGDRRGWVDACLWLVAQAADALEHAHAQGIVHRDIKPSNLMVMRGGRVRVLDFGLARADGVHTMTAPGAPLGSLPYMAPEQLRGELAEPNARIDVYGLGVTLYELLCLRQAYDAPTTEALRTRILEGMPVAPQRHNPQVHWDAETVCLTAMDLDPGRRYATASAFAADLRRALAGEPIAARRPGPWRRTRRWAQRRPAHATALVLGGLMAVGIPSLYSLQAELGRRRLQTAYRAVDAARAVAEASLDDAVAAVTTMVDLADSHQLAMQPGTDPVRAELFDTARALFHRIAERHADDQRVNRHHADALYRAGRADQLLGAFDSSDATLRRARDVATAAGQDRLALRATLLLGQSLAGRDRADEAKAEFALLPDPDTLDCDPMLLASVHQLAASLHSAAGEWQRAVDALSAALAVLDVDDADAETLSLRASVLRTRCYLQVRRLDHEDYAPAFEEATAILRRVIQLQPHVPSHRWRLARTLASWAECASHFRRYDLALAPLEAAAAAIRALVDDYPHRPGYAADLLKTRYQLSLELRRTGATQQAEAPLRRGVAEAADALRRHPDADDVVSWGAVVHGQLGRMLAGRGDLDAAEPLWDRCHSLWETLLDEPDPGWSRLGRGGVHYDHWARFQLRLGHLQAARDGAARACELHRLALPGLHERVYRSHLGGSLLLRAELEVALGDTAAALATLAEAVDEARVDAEALEAESFAPLAGRSEWAALRARAAAPVNGR